MRCALSATAGAMCLVTIGAWVVIELAVQFGAYNHYCSLGSGECWMGNLGQGRENLPWQQHSPSYCRRGRPRLPLVGPVRIPGLSFPVVDSAMQRSALP